jgi:hypothetical protein
MRPNLNNIGRVSCHERVLGVSQAAPACTARSAGGRFGRYYSFVRLGRVSGLGYRVRCQRIDLSHVAPAPSKDLTMPVERVLFPDLGHVLVQLANS